MPSGDQAGARLVIAWTTGRRFYLGAVICVRPLPSGFMTWMPLSESERS